MTKKSSKRSDTKIRNMRQGQAKIKLDIKKPSPSLPPLPLPFPPTQKVEQIVKKLVAKPRLARFPNAFIMYRNEYVQFLKSQGYHISMTELSPMISTSWKKEAEYVKETYTKLSSEAEKMYVRDSGSTQQQINYKYLPTQRTTKLDTEIAIPKLDDPHQPQLHPSSYDFYNLNNLNNLNIYDRLLQISTPNAFPREPPINGELSFSLGTTSEPSKYSLDNSPKIDNSQDNYFLSWPTVQDFTNIRSPTQLPPITPITPISQDCYSPGSYSPGSYNSPSSYSPSTNPSLEDLMSPTNLIGLDTQLSMSPTTPTSSSLSDTSFEEISSLLFSPELDDGRFDFSTSTFNNVEPINNQSSLESPDLYSLGFGQQFTNA